MVKIVFFCMLLVGCARLATLPPNQETAKLLMAGNLKRPLNLSEVWFNLYSKGQLAKNNGDYAGACEQFGRLISYEDFPLIELAKLYQLETCSYTGNAFPHDDLEKLEKGFPSGFLPEFREVAYRLAQRFSDPKTRAQAALNLARVRTLRNEKEALFQEAWELAPVGELKEEAQSALFEYAPRFNPNPELAQLPDVARDFERAREFERAKALYQKILKEDPKKDFKRWLSAAHRYRLIFKNQRDKEGHLKQTQQLKILLEKMLKKSSGNDVVDALADMMVQEARAVWTENQRTEGDLILRQAIEFLPNMSVDMKALIHWIRGMMALEAKDHMLAKKLFRQGIDLNPEDKKLKQDLVWNLAWTYYLDNENDAFIALCLEAQENLGDELFEKLEFWKGKALWRLGRRSESLETWTNLYQKKPFNYYGLMAQVSAGENFESIAVTPNTSPQSLEVEWLAAFQQWDLCRQYLDDWRSKPHLSSTKAKWLPSFIRCRHAAGAIRVYFSHSDASDANFMRQHLASLFPLSFKNEVFIAAQKFSVDPYLLQAIIRQESAFNPEARSPADAFGLMQLIPELAKRLSKKHQLPYRKYDDLYGPDLNVTLGAAYVKELFGRMDQRMVAVIAAYNAGTAPVFNWYKTRNRKDVFEFIEEIAYEETRNYVKLVLRNWLIYQQIERTSSFSLPLELLH